MHTAIEVRGLRKSFGRRVALNGLDLTVGEGEVHGFLGPNGAGKSTTIRTLLGLIRPDSGRARVLGADPVGDAVALHTRLAYVPGDVALWPNLTGGEAIDVITRLRTGGKRPAPEQRNHLERLLNAFQLDPTVKVRAYSKGNRQKVALIAAFATPAELYLLDEPTSGLDPLMERVFRDEIARVAETNATVLLSSHILSEVEQLCDRVSIIRAGVTVESGSLAELRHLTRTEFSYRHEADESDAAVPVERAIPAGLVPLVSDAAIDGDRVRFTADTAAVPSVLAALSTVRLSGLVVSPPSLETIFLRNYGDQPAGPSQPADPDPPADPDQSAHTGQPKHAESTNRSPRP